MSLKLEVQNLEIQLKGEILNQMIATGALSIVHPLPVIPGDIEILPEKISWTQIEENQNLFQGLVNLNVHNPDWNIRTIIDLYLSMKISSLPFKWMNPESILIEKLKISEKSKFLINTHQIHLTPSINQILEVKRSEITEAGKTTVLRNLDELSKKYFGNDILVRLWKDLHFQFLTHSSSQDLIFHLSASEKVEHIKNNDPASSYVEIDIPGNDFQNLLSRLPVPPLSAAGYHMEVKKIEVTGDNKLKINLKDETKNLEIDLETKIELNDNILKLNIGELNIKGLGWVKAGLFKVLKNLIIRQVENKPLNIAEIYRSFIYELSRKYPFLQIQQNKELILRQMSITSENFSASIYFLEKLKI